MREKMFLYSLTWRYDFALTKDDGYNEAMCDDEDTSTISLLLRSNFILLVFFSTYISEFYHKPYLPVLSAHRPYQELKTF